MDGTGMVRVGCKYDPILIPSFFPRIDQNPLEHTQINRQMTQISTAQAMDNFKRNLEKKDIDRNPNHLP